MLGLVSRHQWMDNKNLFNSKNLASGGPPSAHENSWSIFLGDPPSHKTMGPKNNFKYIKLVILGKIWWWGLLGTKGLAATSIQMPLNSDPEYQVICSTCAVYFNHRLGAAHPKRWSKPQFSIFFEKQKWKKSKKSKKKASVKLTSLVLFPDLT